MNLFCFSLEGSMDSLYQPVPEQQANQESKCGQLSSPMSPNRENGQMHQNVFMVSHLENEKSKDRKSFQRFPSANKIFGNTVKDTIWQEPRNPESDSHIRRSCQPKDPNEDSFSLTDNIYSFHEKNIQGTSYQGIRSGNDPLGSTGTLKRLQKLMWTKKARMQSLDEVKPTLINNNDNGISVPCMKFTKFQEMKANHVSARKKEEMDARLELPSMYLRRSRTLNEYHFEDVVYPYEDKGLMWKSWKPCPENPPWTFVDFQISRVGPWNECFSCIHHSHHLKSSHTDMDLLHSWRSSSLGNFDHLRNNSVSKADDSIEVHGKEPINESEEQNKSSNNGGSLGKKMRAISWTMRKKVSKKYIKALSEEKDEENREDALPYRNSDPLIGTHTEKCSLKASDSIDSLYSGQSSSSGITSCSDGTSNRNSLRLDDDVPYSGPFCGRARVHTDFTPSPYDNDSLKIKKGDIIDIICKTPMGMWTGMLNNKVGNFKFIYVDVISEEETAPKKIKTHRRSTSEVPKTLKEFLEKIHLQEYTSTLLLNGYETLEDLKDITESHLIELNIANPEDRMRLLSAAENLLDEEIIEGQENESVSLSLSPDISSNKSQLDDCPRDSGCYMSSGNSDNGKEDLESESLPDMMEKITLTESSD